MNKKTFLPGQGVTYLGVETIVVRVHKNGLVEIKNPDYGLLAELMDQVGRDGDFYTTQPTIKVSADELEEI